MSCPSQGWPPRQQLIACRERTRTQASQTLIRRSQHGTAEGSLDSTFFDDFVDAYWLRNEQYVLQFRASQPGATLHVNFTMAAQSNGDNEAQSQPGKVLLSAASLAIAK